MAPNLRTIVAPSIFDVPPLSVDTVRLFLAGGITGCPDWQQYALHLLDIELDDIKLDVFNPRRPEFDTSNREATKTQIEWEYHALKHSDYILFWFCKETVQPIVLFELGSHISKPNIFVGVHPEYPRYEDVYYQIKLARPELKIYSSIDSLCEAVTVSLRMMELFEREQHKWLYDQGACTEAMAWVGRRSREDALANGLRPDWMLWLAGIEGCKTTDLVSIACRCVRLVLHCVQIPEADACIRALEALSAGSGDGLAVRQAELNLRIQYNRLERQLDDKVDLKKRAELHAIEAVFFTVKTSTCQNSIEASIQAMKALQSVSDAAFHYALSNGVTDEQVKLACDTTRRACSDIIREIAITSGGLFFIPRTDLDFLLSSRSNDRNT